MPRMLPSFAFLLAMVLAGCGGGGGEDATSSGPGVTQPEPTTTPATASFPAGAAFKAYAAGSRQQNFTLSPFGYCYGNATLTETAPASATFEGRAAQRKTSTLVSRYTNCVPNSVTATTEIYLDANNAEIGEVRNGAGYTVLDQPLVLPASVKVGDTGDLGTGKLYSDATKATLAGTVAYSYAAIADNRADAILVRVTAATTGTLGQMPSTIDSTYRLTSGGAMTLYIINQTENGRRFLFNAQ